MKNILMTASAAALALFAIATPAHSSDYWNSSGFPLDHKFHSPYDNMITVYAAPSGGGVSVRGGSVQSSPRIIYVPPGYFDYERKTIEVVENQADRDMRAQNARAVAKAVAQQHTCGVVTIQGDIVEKHRAGGCR